MRGQNEKEARSEKSFRIATKIKNALKTGTKQTLYSINLAFQDYTVTENTILSIKKSIPVKMSGTVEMSEKGGTKCKMEAPVDKYKTTGMSVALNKYKINFGIPSRKSVFTFVAGSHGDNSWQVKIHKFLDQKWVEYTLIGLLCLDIIIIFTELFLQTHYPLCQYVTRDCMACCPSSDSEADHNGEDNPNRWLAGDDHHESYCDAGYDMTGEAACDDHKYESVHAAEETLFYCTVIILS